MIGRGGGLSGTLPGMAVGDARQFGVTAGRRIDRARGVGLKPGMSVGHARQCGVTAVTAVVYVQVSSLARR